MKVVVLRFVGGNLRYIRLEHQSCIDAKKLFSFTRATINTIINNNERLNLLENLGKLKACLYPRLL